MNPEQVSQPINIHPAGGYANQPITPVKKSKSSAMPWILLAIIIVIALVVLGFVYGPKFLPKKTSDLSGYTAVFLTNGQVYFGHLTRANSEYPELTDIFYLQVNQSLQSGANGSTTPAATSSTDSNQQPQLSLVKLGNELHGPADQMFIGRDQILFYEYLKSDGKVAQAIQAYKANPNAAATGTTPAQTGNPQSAAPTSAGGAAANPNQPVSAPATSTTLPAAK